MYKLFVLAVVLAVAQGSILPGPYVGAPLGYAPYPYAAGVAPYAPAPLGYAHVAAPVAYAHPVPATKVVAEAPIVEETLEAVEEHGYKIAF